MYTRESVQSGVFTGYVSVSRVGGARGEPAAAAPQPAGRRALRQRGVRARAADHVRGRVREHAQAKHVLGGETGAATTHRHPEMTLRPPRLRVGLYASPKSHDISKIL